MWNAAITRSQNAQQRMLSRLTLRCDPALSLRYLKLEERSYSRTTSVCNEEATQPATTKEDDVIAIKLRNKLAARDFNNRRAAYQRQVSELRRQYAEEVAKQRAADQAEREAKQREATRQRLERQRLKNIRSAQNAMRQEEQRQERAREFQKHLENMQRKREATNLKYARARQLVIDELEKEAPLWLTTHEEVENAFTHEAEQLLWARPGGVLGAPNPSLDTHFWSIETHTWHMTKTYKSPKEILYQKLKEKAYEEANIDKKFWTKERLEEQIKLEEKARLRAMVQASGRSSLLKRQRAMIEEHETIEPGEIPKPIQVPSRRVLRDTMAHEKEGAKILLRDPTKFFVFDATQDQNDFSGINVGSSSYAGPSLGSPVALRDLLRLGSPNDSVFPTVVGLDPKVDKRTEREKKQQLREARLLEAAKADAQSENLEIELAMQDMTMEDLRPDIDYDEMDKLLQAEYESEDWLEDQEPGAADNSSKTRRAYNKKAVDWVLQKLGEQIDFHELQLKQDVEGLKQKVQSEARQEMGVDGRASVFEEGSIEAALMSMPEKELVRLTDLDDRFLEGMSEDEIVEAAKEFKALTLDQVKAILERDR